MAGSLEDQTVAMKDDGLQRNGDCVASLHVYGSKREVFLWKI